ncbi:MAG TPA: hypothetical protein VGC26_01295 [Afipia sp.]
MTIKTRLAAAAIAALTLTGGIAATTSQAQAGHHGGGLGIGIAAGLLAGAVIANNAYAEPAYVVDYGPRRCGWVRQVDAYGNYVGRVRSCAY